MHDVVQLEKIFAAALYRHYQLEKNLFNSVNTCSRVPMAV